MRLFRLIRLIRYRLTGRCYLTTPHMHVMCEGCQLVACHGADASEARANARAEGYVRRDGRDLCPSCSDLFVALEPATAEES